MFSKDQRPKTDASSAPHSSSSMSASIPSTPSIISADLHIMGDLKSNSDIQIDGRIDGDVISRSVTVGESAEVNGTVICDRIRVCGRLSGEVRSNSVVIAKSARINGDIAHKSLEIEAGAALEGGIRRLEGDPLAMVEAKDKSIGDKSIGDKSISNKGAGDKGSSDVDSSDKALGDKSSSVTKLSDAASSKGSARTAAAL